MTSSITLCRILDVNFRNQIFRPFWAKGFFAAFSQINHIFSDFLHEDAQYANIGVAKLLRKQFFACFGPKLAQIGIKIGLLLLSRNLIIEIF